MMENLNDTKCTCTCTCAKKINNIPCEKNEDVEVKMPKKVRKREIISEVFTDYCKSTSLHGMGYLGAQNKKISEKIWWVTVFVLSLLACSYLITRTWIKWKTDPVILSFEKEQMPIWEIPFPAVTVCPVNKIVQTEYNYTEKFRNRNNLTGDEYKEFWDLSLVCNLEQYMHVDFNCTLDTTDEEAINSITYYSAPREKTIVEPKWHNRRTRSMDLFNKQITEEGPCYTFNSLSPEDMFNKGVYISRDLSLYRDNFMSTNWTLEKGYPDKIKQTDYPRRTTKDGITSGLTFMLTLLQADIDYVCGMPIAGFKVILHSPAEVPDAAQQYILVPATRKVNIVIKPELTKTSETLKSLPAEIRKCYFSEERSLRFFKIYTQSNCRLECTANITFQYCDCIPFYLPRFENTTICGFGSRECVEEVEDNILELGMEKSSSATEEEKENMEFTMEIYKHCNCLPSCNSLEYNSEISQSKYHFVKTMLASGLFDDDLPIEMQEQLNSGFMIVSHVDIFFKQSQFYVLKRSEMYGQVDFLANVGGLLGLFMGFSLLSLLEIVYFLTIRIWIRCADRSLI